MTICQNMSVFWSVRSDHLVESFHPNPDILSSEELDQLIIKHPYPVRLVVVWNGVRRDR